MAATPSPSTGLQSLHRLKQTEPPMYLTPSPDLSHLARTASHHLFTLLKPYTPKSPFDRLLVDPHFDAEQIWQQIDLQSQPLISSLRRHVGMFEKDPKVVKRSFEDMGCEKIVEKSEKNDDFDELDDDVEEGDDEVEEGGDDVEDEVEGGVKRDVGGGGDDKDNKDLFYDSDEMIKFMDGEDAKEFGGGKAKKAVKKTGGKYEEDDEEDEDEDEEDDEFGILGLAGDESDSEPEEIHYKDFYLSNKKNDQSKKPKANKEVEDMNVNEEEEEENEDLEDGDEDDEEDGEEDDDEDGEEDEDMASDEEKKRANLSTHEKQLIEQRAKIEQVEKESLDAKAWTMQGEVSATKRPKNSALEVDLDWERNAKPPPVITEEVSQSIEELIMKRISEGHFDDVERVNRLPSKAPREMKELDENQNKKGLGEIYADEYAQKTGLVSKALSFSDEQKKEAALLFKKLCVKLDSLSHFHFTPKPEIRDMTIETNVPALAMEEIAPLAVSDAAMLAPEEVFAGKGDIKEEAELTQADRKRRRAGFKRKYKAENANKTAKKPREKTLTAGDGKEEL